MSSSPSPTDLNGHEDRARGLGPFRLRLQSNQNVIRTHGDRCIFKSTEYFRYTRQRADRAGIRDEWIELAIQQPLAEHVQGDGRTRRWVYIPEEQRYLRVILLADGETVHNAFFDRRFRP